jgi:hypothetical protein
MNTNNTNTDMDINNINDIGDIDKIDELTDEDLNYFESKTFKLKKCIKCKNEITENEDYFSDDEFDEICSDKDKKPLQHHNNKYCDCGGLMYCIFYTVTRTKEN